MDGSTGTAVGCPLRINRLTLTARRSLPVFPRKRTSSEQAVMSQRCQTRTSRPLHSITSSARASSVLASLGKKGDYLPDKPMRCNRVAETTSNVKRYLTVRFDGWNSDERRALHSATSLARQNASPLARSPRYSVARIGGCCDGRCCVGRGGTDLLARVTGASALM